jgi:hypothetical protein
LANRKKNKLDIYAETRIWNLKLQNKNLATDELMKEIIDRFQLEDTVSLFPKLQKIIQSARRRVLRRHNMMKKNIKTWSLKLSLPEKAVSQWTRQGLLTEDNIEAVYEVLMKFRELMRSESAC